MLCCTVTDRTEHDRRGIQTEEINELSCTVMNKEICFTVTKGAMKELFDLCGHRHHHLLCCHVEAIACIQFST